VTEPSFDIAKIVARSREVAGKLNAGVGVFAQENKIDVNFRAGAAERRRDGGGFARPKGRRDAASAYP